MKYDKVLLIDNGGNDVLGFARAIRDLGVFTEVKTASSAMTLDASAFKGIVVSVSADNIDRKWSFHPEKPLLFVSDKNQDAMKDVEKFLKDECKTNNIWNMHNFVEEKIQELKNSIGDKKVLLALSGGVDSSVAALLLNKAIGENLHCIFVDHGLLRKNEAEQVVSIFKDKIGLNLTAVDSSERFLQKLDGVTDPEKKRKIIGEEFIRVFEEEAKKIGKVDFLAQGTIYPDVVESGTDGARIVKSHHNVGGLPEHVDFDEIIEPLRELFKDEVRAAGEVLGLDHDLVWRQPFPGPGLGVRVVGAIDSNKLQILKNADAIVRDEITKIDLSARPNQYFAVLCDLKSVGMSDNARSYEYTVAIRAVDTGDFMSANWSKLSHELLGRMSERICTEVDGVNRVVYDITSKPPATIEWE